MIKKPNNKQCEIARYMTKSEATNTQIINELNGISQEELNDMCEVLDELLIKHDMTFSDEAWNGMVLDFITASAGGQISEATLFVAYMNWMNSREKISAH